MLAVAAAIAALALTGAAGAAVDPGGGGGSALVDSSDCTQNQLNRNDDGSTSPVSLPFAVDFYGQTYNQLWVNNNGNVTFDGPLSTYTPFGLLGTSSVIIAPFFGDVDTRGSGSDVVRYGYGETTYQGHRAFCVDWVNVGYYSSHYDKLNSFQLLLVQREDSAPGDFDIVFDYGQIQWETGDASGGVGGLGGSSAHVGFSNGDGQVGDSFELDGSGKPGFLLDSNTTFGLVYRSFNSSVPGRFVFPVRNGAPPPDQYVAIGDSYQSGVGAGDYYPETNQSGVNECLRSPNAYAPRLVADGVVPYSLDFVACSGATTSTLYQNGPVTDGPPWNEDAQMNHLSERTALVTLGIGGNDLHFGPLIADCVLKHFIFTSCEAAYDEQVTDALIALLDHSNGLNRLQQVYSDVRFKAWRGRVLVLGYPRFFPLDGGSDWWSSGLLVPRCQNIRVSDQLWINHKIEQLDMAIRASAQSMGLTYVDIYDASDGHELCAGDPGFLNGIDITNRVQSFHPTAYGQGVIEDRIEQALQSGPSGDTFAVYPDQWTTTTVTIASALADAAFSIVWPGSTVQTTLVSPSGRVIDASTVADDVYHRAGPTQELFDLKNPEPGTWTVKMYGAQVQAAGEQTTLTVNQDARPNADPVARFTSSQQGRTVTLDASGSTDSDGQVVKYLWDFGDDTLGTGVTATHTYMTPGTYRTTLVVADDQGGQGFATGAADIVVPRYVFGGFQPPVAGGGALNAAQAGQAIPVQFTLDGVDGPDFFESGFPQVQQIDCSSRAPVGDPVAVASVSGWSTQPPESGTYHYVWKTSKAWGGSCRRLTLGFDDGGRYSADFGFK